MRSNSYRSEFTNKQRLTLSEFARHGGVLIPGNDDVRDTCKQLTKMKYLRPQTVMERLPKTKISVGYQVTLAGRRVSLAADKAQDTVTRHNGAAAPKDVQQLGKDAPQGRGAAKDGGF